MAQPAVLLGQQSCHRHTPRACSSNPNEGSAQQAVLSRQCSAGSAQQAVLSRQCSVGSAQWAVLSRQCLAGSAQWAVLSGQCSAGSAQQAVGPRQMAHHIHVHVPPLTPLLACISNSDDSSAQKAADLRLEQLAAALSAQQEQLAAVRRRAAAAEAAQQADHRIGFCAKLLVQASHATSSPYPVHHSHASLHRLLIQHTSRLCQECEAHANEIRVVHSPTNVLHRLCLEREAHLNEVSRTKLTVQTEEKSLVTKLISVREQLKEQLGANKQVHF
eukprot:1141598-Pelagomonas_calceolata.AAC.2